MKTYFLFILCVVFLGMTSSVKATDKGVKLVPVNILDVIIPEDFTTESDVYVTARGIFPNGCYRWNHGEVTHRDKTLHEIRVMAAVIPGPCKMVLVPFSQNIMMGRFALGQHRLRFFNEDGTFHEKTLNIGQF